jgi:hypothetical protein
MEIQPLLSSAANNHFDAIHEPATEPVKLKAGELLYRIPGAERVIHFEAVPEPEDLPGKESIWHRLQIVSSDAGSQVPLQVKLGRPDDAPWTREWANVGAAETFIQRWTPYGPEQEWDPDLKLPKLCKNVTLLAEDPTQAKQLGEMLENELGDFVDRGDNDAESSVGMISLVPLLEKKGSGLTLYEDKDGQPEHPTYLRATVKLHSRYKGLPGFDDAVKAAVVSGGVDACHKRHLRSGRLRQPLGPPRIKMLVPLIGIEPREDEEDEMAVTHAGFYALCLEPVVSPFHLLEGMIARAPYDGEEYAQIGFDPLTTAAAIKSGNGDFKAPLHGRPFGLTFEREGGDAGYPSSAYRFDCPSLVKDLQEKGRGQDLMIELNFRWRIWEGVEGLRTMDGSVEELRGQPTGNWQARLLARQDEVKLWRKKGAGEELKPGWVRLDRLHFRFDKSSPVFQFEGEDWGIVPPPSVDGSKLYATFAFLTWSLIRDFMHSTMTTRWEGIYLLGKGRAGWKTIWERAGDLSRNETKEGLFVMVLMHEDTTDVSELRKLLSALFPSQTKPDKSGSIYKQATMMPGRMFKPISRQG